MLHIQIIAELHTNDSDQIQTTQIKKLLNISKVNTLVLVYNVCNHLLYITHICYFTEG